jgi:Bacteriophage Sf6, terminase small subunit-like
MTPPETILDVMARAIPQVTIYQPRWSPEDYRQRPTEFDARIAEEIITKVMNGETLNALVANNRDYPLPGTFLLWLKQEPEYNLKYRRAKEIQTELLVDGILEDGKAGTWDAGVRVRAGQIYAEKTDPGRYGPKATVWTPPPEGDNNAPVVDHTAELRRKIGAMAERAKQRAQAATEEGDD